MNVNMGINLPGGGGGRYCMRLFCGSSANTKDEEMDKKCVLMVTWFLS